MAVAADERGVQAQSAPVGYKGQGMPDHYQIRVKTHLDLDWSAWFDELTITHDADGCTTISGRVADQAALYGLISKARNLGLTLVAVCQVAATDATTEPSDGHISKADMETTRSNHGTHTRKPRSVKGSHE